MDGAGRESKPGRTLRYGACLLVVFVVLGNTCSGGNSDNGQVSPPGDATARREVGVLTADKTSTQTPPQCTATVVNSANGSVIVTARHCVIDGAMNPYTDFHFSPGHTGPNPSYSNMPDPGTAPYGTWTSSTAPVYGQGRGGDWAFLALNPLNGRTVQDAVGGLNIAWNKARSSGWQWETYSYDISWESSDQSGDTNRCNEGRNSGLCMTFFSLRGNQHYCDAPLTNANVASDGNGVINPPFVARAPCHLGTYSSGTAWIDHTGNGEVGAIHDETAATSDPNSCCQDWASVLDDAAKSAFAATATKTISIGGVSERAAGGAYPGLGARLADFSGAHLPGDKSTDFDQVGLDRYTFFQVATQDCLDAPQQCVSSFTLFFPQPIPLTTAQSLALAQLPADTVVTSQMTEYYVNQNYPDRYCMFIRSPQLAKRLPNGTGTLDFEANKDDLYFGQGLLPFDPNGVTFAVLSVNQGAC